MPAPRRPAPSLDRLIARFHPHLHDVMQATELLATSGDSALIDLLLGPLDPTPARRDWQPRDPSRIHWAIGHWPNREQGYLHELAGPHTAAVLALLPHASIAAQRRLALGPEVVFDWLTDWYLPDDLRALRDVTTLRITGPHLASQGLPSALGSLPALELLELTRTRLCDEQLAHVRFDGVLGDLYLTHANLTRLPEGLSAAASLRVLSLAYNAVAELPRWLPALSSLAEFDLTGNQLRELPASLGGCLALRSLQANHNRIARVADALGAMPVLRDLSLVANQLREPPPALDRLVALENLDLTQNPLSAAPSLHAARSLATLALARCGLTALPAEPWRLPSLRHLNLSGNALPALPDWITDLASLDHLDVSHNPLLALPEGLPALRVLTFLNASGTGLTALPESIADCPRLTRLVLAGVPLTALPASLRHAPRLRGLVASGTAVTALPEGFSELSSLESLDLSRTPLTALPADFGRLSSLESLDLSQTPLTALPASFPKLPRLAKLSLAHVPLEAFPRNFGELAALRELSLEGVRAPELPRSFARLAELRSLDLSGASFLLESDDIELPSVLAALTGLTHLRANGMRLNVFPIWLERFPAIERLDLAHNDLGHISLALAAWCGPTELDLSHNPIASLPPAFFAWPRLRCLSLAHTAVTALPDDAVAPHLEVIDLRGNPLCKLPPWLLDAAPRLKELYLDPGLPLEETSRPVLAALQGRGLVR